MIKIKPNYNEDSVWGIYSITNQLNNKKYIGLSTNIIRRWNDHKYSLNKNNHENKYLQNSWNKYGKDNFEFEIIHELEEKDIKLLSELEIQFIQKEKTNIREYGYNICEGGEINIISKEILKAKSEKYSKRVAQFDTDGNFIQVYLNARDVGKIYEIDSSSIYQCCRNKINSSYGYTWSFVEKDRYSNNINFSTLIYPLKDRRRVFSFNMIGVKTDEFENCTQAQSKYNKNGDNIRACCVGKNKTAYGMIWMYEDDFLKNGIDFCFRLSKKDKNYNYNNQDKQKPVAMCDKDTGEILKTYKSAREAVSDGFNYRNISQVCKEQRNIHGGYSWKFI